MADFLENADEFSEDELWVLRLMPEDGDIGEEELVKAMLQLSEMRTIAFVINAVEHGYLYTRWCEEHQELTFGITDKGVEMAEFDPRMRAFMG